MIDNTSKDAKHKQSIEKQKARIKDVSVIIGLILLVAAIRLMPHPWNFTPVGALALFCGAYLPQRILWLVPSAALLLGDAFLGFYNLIAMGFVYLGFAASAVIGRAMLLGRASANRIAWSVLAGAVSFALLSNLGQWLLFYPPTLEGIIACYVAAIPFFYLSLWGDALYACALFGGFHLICRIGLVRSWAR